MTLDEALGCIAEGDHSAFGELYEQTRRTVYYIALSYVRERMLAEDVMQATYLKVLGNAARYRRGTNARAWIARIARNEAIDLMRRRSRELSVDERENPLPFGTLPSPEPDYEIIRELRAAGVPYIVAEGRITNGEKMRKALEAGAHSVVIGTSITEPRKIVKTILLDAGL